MSSSGGSRSFSSKGDDLIEQGNHSRMTSYVVDMHQGAYTVVWSQGVVGQFIRRVVVLGELISRRYHCAKAATLHRVGRGGKHAYPSRILRKLAATPMLSIRDQGASLFDDLEL
jgi:hypothetical protein